MTLALAWLARRADGREDLYFAADSRTRGIRVMDLSPKILLLPRSDCAICFSGDTSATYPLMLQLSIAIAAHEPARDRNLDIVELKSHLLRICTDMMGRVTDAALPFEPSDAQFLFGGYSWRSKGFRLWTIYYEAKSKAFRVREAVSFHKRLEKAAFIGDWATRYRGRLMSELVADPDGRAVQLRPLGILAEMIRKAGREDSIGGAPQLLRVGPHMNVRPFCVAWGPQKTHHLFGRPLFEYENCDFWTVDPDSGEICAPRHFRVDKEPKAESSLG